MSSFRWARLQPHEPPQPYRCRADHALNTLDVRLRSCERLVGLDHLLPEGRSSEVLGRTGSEIDGGDKPRHDECVTMVVRYAEKPTLSRHNPGPLLLIA